VESRSAIAARSRPDVRALVAEQGSASGGAAALIRYQLTEACIAAVRAERAAGYPQRELGRLVGLSPVLLSCWLHRRYSGRQRPHPDDQRVKRLARVLELPVEACVEVVPPH